MLGKRGYLYRVPSGIQLLAVKALKRVIASDFAVWWDGQFEGYDRLQGSGEGLTSKTEYLLRSDYVIHIWL
jgi:hypothetical protein